MQLKINYGVELILGAYYNTQEKSVYKSDENLIPKIQADWKTLADYFELKLKYTTDDDW